MSLDTSLPPAPSIAPIVFLVDDDPGALRSLRFLIESDGLEAESFGSAAAFLDFYQPTMLGCLVVDVRMPEMTGLDLQQELAERGSTLPIIVMSGHADVASCTRAFRSGAIDFFEKPVNDNLILERVRHGIERHRQALLAMSSPRQGALQLELLTAREREVMDLLVRGKSLKQIALDLGISIQTSAKHRSRLLEKLKVPSDMELLRRVLEEQRR